MFEALAVGASLQQNYACSEGRVPYDAVVGGTTARLLLALPPELGTAQGKSTCAVVPFCALRFLQKDRRLPET